MKKLNKLMLLSVMLCSLMLAGCKPALEYTAKDITESHFKKPYIFDDLDGKATTAADFKGKVTVVYFGYTFCPDFCPTTLFKLQEVAKILGDKKDIFQAVFVTVDPQRDTKEKLLEYAGNFPDLDLKILRPTEYQLRDMKVKYKTEIKKVPGAIIAEDYTVDHLTSLLLFDKKGVARRGALYEETAEQLAQDIINLDKEF